MKARDFAPVNLGEVARECIDAVRAQAEAKQIAVELASARGLTLVAVRAELESSRRSAQQRHQVQPARRQDYRRAGPSR